MIPHIWGNSTSLVCCDGDILLADSYVHLATNKQNTYMIEQLAQVTDGLEILTVPHQEPRIITKLHI